MCRRLLYQEDEIAATIQRLADELNRDYAGKELHLVVVLNGAFIFAADLVRQLRMPLTIDFVKLTSYNGQQTTGNVRLTKELELPVTGRHLLVLEDIIDTGLTLSYLLALLQAEKPSSLKVCTLLDKPARRQVTVPVDYVGISSKAGFMVGFGLDVDGRYRELPAVYEIE